MSLPDKLKAAGLNFAPIEGTPWLQGYSDVLGDRSQKFFLYNEVDDWGGHGEYDFMSMVGPADDAANVKKACELATGFKRGAIVIFEGQICLKMEIPADLDGEASMMHVQLICPLADGLEKEIFGVDER